MRDLPTDVMRSLSAFKADIKSGELVDVALLRIDSPSRVPCTRLEPKFGPTGGRDSARRRTISTRRRECARTKLVNLERLAAREIEVVIVDNTSQADDDPFAPYADVIEREIANGGNRVDEVDPNDPFYYDYPDDYVA